MPGAVENGHVQALQKELVPQKRTERLKSLHWKLVPLPEFSHVILPDCVALASNHTDLSQLIPYTLIDDETLAGVVMPVSSSRLLVGSQADVVIKWETLNSVLAQSSLEFFISSRNDDELARIGQQIGLAVSDFSQKLVEEDAFDVPIPYSERRQLTASRLVPLVPVVEFLPKALRNRALEATVQKQLRTPELAPYLDHLRAVVVVPDVTAALTQRGLLLNDYGKQQVRFGTCQSSFTPQGFVCEIFVPADLAQLMISVKPEHARSAGTLVRHHLGRAVYIHFFAESVTLQEVQEQRDHLESLLLAMAQLATSHYFGARLSSPKEMGLHEFQMADALHTQVIGWTLEGLSQARAQYLAEPDVDKLLFTLVMLTETLLTTAVSSGALRQVNPSHWESGKCAKMLDEAGLLNWFTLLSRDMEAHFTKRKIWAGLAELEFLASHAERILWEFGFYLSPAGDQIRVDMVNDQELAVLKRLANGMSFIEPS